MSLKRALLGDSPRTTLAGYLLSGVISVQPFLADEFISTKRLIWIFVCAILVAILGRAAADTPKRSRKKVEPPQDI